MDPIDFSAVAAQLRDAATAAAKAFADLGHCLADTFPPLEIDATDLFPFPRVPRFLHARPAYASALSRVTPGGVVCRKARRVRRCSPRTWCGR